MSKPVGHYVTVGGGAGATYMAEAMLPYADRITEICAVTDSGRSTREIRQTLHTPAPGDVGNALFYLSERSHPDSHIQELARRMQLRAIVEGHPISGMPPRNLLIGVSCRHDKGKIGPIIEVLNEVFLPRGVRVYPVADADIHLGANLEDGSERLGELEVRGVNKPRIVRVYHEPKAELYPASQDAVINCDLLTVGPGSLFVSVLANLLVGGMKEAWQESRAVRGYIANTTTQRGQTDGFTLFDHVRWVYEALGGALDFVLLNSREPSEEVLQRIVNDGVEYLRATEEQVEAIEGLGLKVFLAPIIEDDGMSRGAALWEKDDTIRHDQRLTGEKLAQVYVTRLTNIGKDIFSGNFWEA